MELMTNFVVVVLNSNFELVLGHIYFIAQVKVRRTIPKKFIICEFKQINVILILTRCFQSVIHRDGLISHRIFDYMSHIIRQFL